MSEASEETRRRKRWWHDRLIRPRARYTGPQDLEFVDIDER
ncbi:hypothetical protein ACFQMA_14070 [Halosimplex aquaticum]|uniref:Uncharacterized protein n=1 Tax=Halosimplex aquaticum TaxID=3026162 RepID=A0ABD5Y128_9EURY|nr:hypothetical protein [Halosimplex aquaticum]